jgi:RNA polymerase sigma-70 factor (ECF subfamily)
VHLTKISESPGERIAREDQQLMRRVASRDRVAQKELVERLVGRVRRVCRSLMDDPSEADDASQQALVEILQSARNFREPGNLGAWADTIAVRTTLRMARRLRESRAIVLQVPLIERLAGLGSDLRKKNITSTQLGSYLDRLPEQKRQAFVLKHGLGYTVEEIARLTDSPLGTVKDRLVAARKELRTMVARDLSTNQGRQG